MYMYTRQSSWFVSGECSSIVVRRRCRINVIVFLCLLSENLIFFFHFPWKHNLEQKASATNAKKITIPSILWSRIQFDFHYIKFAPVNVVVNADVVRCTRRTSHAKNVQKNVSKCLNINFKNTIYKWYRASREMRFKAGIQTKRSQIFRVLVYRFYNGFDFWVW